MFLQARHVNERQRSLRGLGDFRANERVRYLRGLGQVELFPAAFTPTITITDPAAAAAAGMQLSPAAFEIPVSLIDDSSGAVVTPSTQVVATPTQQQGAPIFSAQWMKQTSIPGVPNSYLVLGVAGVFFAAALKKKKR